MLNWQKIKDNLIHFFTPTEENNYRAKALQLDFLTYYLVLAIVLVFSVNSFGKYFNNILGYATDINIEKLFNLTNQERRDNNLSPLKYNEKLAYAAQLKAKDMFARNYWSHYGPDGTTPWEFILASDYQYEYAGENLAKNFLFSQGVIDAWMHSPSHKDNLLKNTYTEVGFAVVNGILNGEETTLVVQMFGKPLASNMLSQPIDQESKSKIISRKEQLVKTDDFHVRSFASQPKVNLANFSFDFTYVFIGFFILALLADFYIATKLNIIRINGKNIAHLIFMAVIFISVALIIKKGTIL